jgi:hypothetical protein
MAQNIDIAVAVMEVKIQNGGGFDQAFILEGQQRSLGAFLIPFPLFELTLKNSSYPKLSCILPPLFIVNSEPDPSIPFPP